MKAIFEKFESLSGASFITIKGYTSSSSGEVADITINTNISSEVAKQKDLNTLKALKVSDLEDISVANSLPLETLKIALDELIVSAEKNLQKDFNERSNQSKGTANAYVSIGKGLKLHKDTLDVHIVGLRTNKKVIVKGTYKKTNKREKTLCKEAIQKHCDLRMLKYRTLKIGQADAIKIKGDVLSLSDEPIVETKPTIETKEKKVVEKRPTVVKTTIKKNITIKKHVPCTEISKRVADKKCELIYLESPCGFHFAIDATYLDQVDDFEMTLPTGEIFKSKDLD